MEAEARLAAIEARLDFLTNTLLLVAGGLQGRGALTDGAWNALFDAIEAIGRTGEPGGWDRSQALRATLSKAVR